LLALSKLDSSLVYLAHCAHVLHDVVLERSLIKVHGDINSAVKKVVVSMPSCGMHAHLNKSVTDVKLRSQCSLADVRAVAFLFSNRKVSPDVRAPINPQLAEKLAAHADKWAKTPAG
jgi:hypothetical protein